MTDVDILSMMLAAQGWERPKLERLCRYIMRPRVSEKRISLAPSDNIRYLLKTPYSDGTTQVIFEPQDFIVKPAALVLKPSVNLNRFYGVFAPNSKYRGKVMPARHGKGNKPSQSKADKTHEQRHQAMTWTQRLYRVFSIDLPKCGGEAKVIAIASIAEPSVIEKMPSLGPQPFIHAPLLITVYRQWGMSANVSFPFM